MRLCVHISPATSSAISTLDDTAPDTLATLHCLGAAAVFEVATAFSPPFPPFPASPLFPLFPLPSPSPWLLSLLVVASAVSLAPPASPLCATTSAGEIDSVALQPSASL